MSLRSLTPAAVVVVCLITAIGVVAQEVTPRSEPAADARAPIVLTEGEAAFIRTEMRGLLDSVRDILAASSTGDSARTIAAARRAGMNGPEIAHIPKTIAPKLPPEFKKLGLATHRGFDQIAQELETNGRLERVPAQLADLMNNCSGCHAAWRLRPEASR